MVFFIDMTEFFEQTPSAEHDSELRKRRSILASYVMGTLINASSEGFRQGLDQATGYITEHTHYADGRLITDDDIKSFAASSVMVQMVDSFIKRQPLLLSPDVPRALSVYHEAQATIDETGLTLVKSDLDLPTARVTGQRLNGKDVPTTPNIEVAVSVLNARGTVKMEVESLDDIQAAIDAKDYSSEAPDIYHEAENGTRIEGYNLGNLTVPSRIEELPYYAQFYEVKHGLPWLTSLLEDMKAIHSRMQ